MRKKILKEINKNLLNLQNDIKDVSKRVAFYMSFKDREYRDYHLGITKENLQKDSEALEIKLRVLRDILTHENIDSL